MKKLLLFCFLYSSPITLSAAWAGSAILNLTGNYNTISATQLGDTSVSIIANNLNNSNVAVDQRGGGNHSANIELYGNFYNYNISVAQNSSVNQSFSIQQYCASSCNPNPLTVTQTFNPAPQSMFSK